MIPPIQIKNPDVVRDIRLLAELTGEPITGAVADAVRAKLDQALRAKELQKATRRRQGLALRREFAALRKKGKPLTDADLYDEDGLPK